MFASKGDISSLDASAHVLTRQTFTKSSFRPTKPILSCQSEPLDSYLHHGFKKKTISSLFKQEFGSCPNVSAFKVNPLFVLVFA